MSTAESRSHGYFGIPKADGTMIRPPGDSKEIIALLDEWLRDESGYDERVWPELKAALERNRLNSRSLFNG